MRMPTAIYKLEPVLDEDPRFDGFVFFKRDVSAAFAEAYDVFNLDDGGSIHWQPRKPGGEWKPLPVTGPVKPFNDYPCLNLIIPAYSRRAVDALGEMLTQNGQLLALETDVGEYYGYVGHTKIEALDLQKSRLRRSSPDKTAVGVGYFAFNPVELAGASIFRIPEQPNSYFVTDLFKERVEQARLNGFHFIPVWPLPEDSDWLMEETYRRRKRKKVKLVGEALVLRFLLESDQPNDLERNLATAIENSLREQLKVNSSNDRYPGSIEATEFEAGEFRVFCICPDCEELEKHLQPWLNAVNWPNGIASLKRYGNLYAGRPRQRSVEVRKPKRPIEDTHWLKAKVESRRQRQLKGSNKKMKSHSESELSNEMPEQIKDSAVEALSMLGLDEQADSQTVIAAVDQFVYEWQCGKRPPIPCEAEDLPYTLGSLWGEQMVRQFGWEWKKITFHEHGDTWAPGVVSPDRSMAIYPIHFIIGCMNDSSVDATILLSFNMLKEHEPGNSKRGAYDNVMEQVFRIVPRIASLDTDRS